MSTPEQLDPAGLKAALAAAEEHTTRKYPQTFRTASSISTVFGIALTELLAAAIPAYNAAAASELDAGAIAAIAKAEADAKAETVKDHLAQLRRVMNGRYSSFDDTYTIDGRALERMVLTLEGNNPFDDEHAPCCSSHGVPMSCERYRRTHFVEVRPCCSTDAARLKEEAKK